MKYRCSEARRNLKSSVMLVAVILHQMPARIWDDIDYEDLEPTTKAYVKLQGGGEGEDPDKPGVENLHAYDRALIQDARNRRKNETRNEAPSEAADQEEGA